jgi:hypothetical protein
MDARYYDLVNRCYRDAGGDFTELFHTVLAIGTEIGWDRAWGCLQQCVIDKRLAWLGKNLEALQRTGDPLLDGYRSFYEVYLGVSTPRDGQIVEATDRRLVTRWWNRCPTLEACTRLGLDTRVICKQVYQEPVQVFLSAVDSRLRFARSYEAIRPYAPYCEEIIMLEDSGRVHPP